MKIHPVATDLINADKRTGGQTDRWTYVTELIGDLQDLGERA